MEPDSRLLSLPFVSLFAAQLLAQLKKKTKKEKKRKDIALFNSLAKTGKKKHTKISHL